MENESTDEAKREVVVSRLIDGPRRLVFRAYTSAEHVAHWWGPAGFSITTQSFEFRPGGEWLFVMHGPDGVDYPNWVRWLEIEEPSRIVLLHGAHVDDPASFTSFISFVEVDGRTELTMRALFKTQAQRDEVVERYGAIEGGRQTLQRLADYLAAHGGELT
ncbi:MAG: SRPBCC family protein [Polyangiaceae bacterium]